MKTILISYFSAARSLGRPGILWHLMWPTLVASVVWTSLLVMNWGALADLGTHFITALPLAGDWRACRFRSAGRWPNGRCSAPAWST